MAGPFEAVHRAIGSVSEILLGLLLVRSLSSESKYSRTGRDCFSVGPQSITSVPRMALCRHTSALTRLASIAKPSPLTKPCSMQR